MKNITPLLRFMRAMTAEQKTKFAADASEFRARLARSAGHPQSGEAPITKLYLTQLACMDPSPNPALLTAIPIVEASRKWSHLLGEPPLTLADLLVPTIDPDKPLRATGKKTKSPPAQPGDA